MPVVTTDYLRTLQQQLRHYVDPGNTDGFYRVFVIWVINSWRKARYYDTEIRNMGYARSLFPVTTDEWLRDRILCYREFINSNTGISVYGFQPGIGICCETYESKLQELYGSSCARQIELFVNQHKLVMPFQKGAATTRKVSEAILLENFDPFQHAELASISHEIHMEFGPKGWAQTPYTCPLSRSGCYTDNKYGGWSLRDFKKAMVV
jgi:hypothetical protein